MTITADQIMDLGGQTLPFARDLREAIGIYARRRWPRDTSGHMAKAWGLPKATAKNVLKGSASDATVTAILRAGGWSLAMAVVGATIGQPLEDFIAQERERLANERRAAEARERRLVEMGSYLAAGGPLGPGGARRPDLRAVGDGGDRRG